MDTTPTRWSCGRVKATLHNTAAGYSQTDYFGGHGLLDATPDFSVIGKKETGLNMGLPGHRWAWWSVAEENTRESIRHAIRRPSHQRRAHQGPTLLWMGFSPRRPQPEKLGDDRV